MAIRIRKAEQTDFKTIYSLVQEAFSRAEHSDGQEQELVRRLWESSDYLPDLSLLAEIHGEIVGYLLLSKIRIADSVELGLAPLAVRVDFQKMGVGSSLIEEAHRRAKQAGYHAIIVLGDDQYYSKFGYVSASEKGIFPPFDVPASYFMVYELINRSNDLGGIVQYPLEFEM